MDKKVIIEVFHDVNGQELLYDNQRLELHSAFAPHIHNEDELAESIVQWLGDGKATFAPPTDRAALLDMFWNRLFERADKRRRSSNRFNAWSWFAWVPAALFILLYLWILSTTKFAW